MVDIDTYGLDLHSSMILEEYRENRDVYEEMKSVVLEKLRACLSENNIYVTAVEARVKEEKSLAGKLELKGAKYSSIMDITDILGARVVTFYADDVDKISALMKNLFEIDWQNSVDKRKMHEIDSFGYMSLHHVCRIPKSLYYNPEHPSINEIRFELQMRTALQHVWATLDHDTGYKSGVEVPREYIRSLNRLAGLLELADDEFGRIRVTINDYRRKVEGLVSNGKFDEVSLNVETFRSYLALEPFNQLLEKIAAVNQAEIHKSSSMPYLRVLLYMGFKTLGDLERLKEQCSECAYQLALSQIAGTDIDIISSTVALQDLCLVYILMNGGGKRELIEFFNMLNGASSYNEDRAERVIRHSSQLSFMNRK